MYCLMFNIGKLLKRFCSIDDPIQEVCSKVTAVTVNINATFILFLNFVILIHFQLLLVH